MVFTDNVFSGAPVAREEIDSSDYERGKTCERMTVPEAVNSVADCKSEKHGETYSHKHSVEQGDCEVEFEIS